MNEREQTVRLWFDMWLQAEDRGITSIFAPDCIYTESWGPEYHSAAQVKHWFEEWNTRGRVLVWDILRFFHAENHTAVEWRFKNQMLDGRVGRIRRFFAHPLDRGRQNRFAQGVWLQYTHL